MVDTIKLVKAGASERRVEEAPCCNMYHGHQHLPERNGKEWRQANWRAACKADVHERHCCLL